MTGAAMTSGEIETAFVDTHHHFQDYGGGHYPWLADRSGPEKLEGDLEPIRRDYGPADHAADLADYRVVGRVHIENGWTPSDPVGETRWLESLAARSGAPDVIVARADLAAPDVERVLAAQAAFPRVHGIRQILNWHDEPRLRVASRPDQTDDPAWRRGFALLTKYRLSFDLQIYWPQMRDARRLAFDFPETTIVLDHFGMPIDRRAEGIAEWAAAMTALAAAPNVAVKLSGFGLGHPHWTLDDTVPLLRRTIDIFGPDRVTVGSNLPVDRLFASGRRIGAAMLAAVADLTPDERRRVLIGNAERLYRFTARTTAPDPSGSPPPA